MQDEGVVHVDARGLEPPQPLVRILEALEALPAGATLHARTDRNPIHLHGMLTQRGFTGRTTPSPDDEPGFLTVIHRAD